MNSDIGSYSTSVKNSIESKSLPVIVIIGLNEKTIQILGSYIAKKYYLLVFNHNFSIQRLESFKDITLFLVNTDCFWIKIPEILNTLQENETYQNIPTIGLALKRHFSKMPQEERILYEDIVAMPCSTEDLLSRIDVWVRTHELIKEDRGIAKAVKSDEFTQYDLVDTPEIIKTDKNNNY
ncbi:MAG: hypothetical protein GY870_19850 [archaeon]|nr:hypothetical protein [archaeon]